MKKFVNFLMLFLASFNVLAASNSNPGLYYGQVPTAAQWNSYFSSKLDYSPGAANNLPYWDASGNLLAAPVSGSCTFAAGVFNCATGNLYGGTVGAIPYQSAPDTTLFLSGNTTTTPRFVTSTGTGAAAQAPILTGSTGSGSVVLSASPTITGTLAAASISSSGTISGTGFSNYLASPPAIGGTTPAAGAFTSVAINTAATLSTQAPQAAQIQAQSLTAFTTAGTSTAYTLTPVPAISAYAIGQEFDIVFNAACGATPTININGLGAINLVSRLADGTYYNIPSGRIPINWRSKGVMVSLTQMLVREPPAASKLSTYTWNAWNPSDLAATPTNAPAAGTNYDSLFTTNANSAGTLTITFDIAGVYLVHLLLQASHANPYSQEILTGVLGGTAARVIGAAPRYSGDTASDSSGGATTTFRCSATVGQTLTILPVYYLTGAGVIADHTAYAQVNIDYRGF